MELDDLDLDVEVPVGVQPKRKAEPSSDPAAAPEARRRVAVGGLSAPAAATPDTLDEELEGEGKGEEEDAEDLEVDPATAAALKRKKKNAITTRTFLEPELKQYYREKFPADIMYRWLSYGDPKVFKNREFSFTLKDDVYIRYQSFGSAKELRKAMMSATPHKIDIGAVFSAPPDKHDTMTKEAFLPVQREFVLDIDLTDYDEIRTCCSGGAICQLCWKFMHVAVKVVDDALREDFGYEQILWVYSGRRGIHCWVCDKEARELTNEQRGALIGYLNAFKGGSDVPAMAAQIPLTRPLHPSFQRAHDALEPFFIEHIISAKGQALLCSEEQWVKVLDLLPPSPTDLRTLVEAKFHDIAKDERKGHYGKHGRKKDNLAATDRWTALKNLVATALKRTNINYSPAERADLQRCVAAIVFVFTYPRLDVNVSKHRNHLLKSPFVVHPKTGRICVPFSPRLVSKFNPESVPDLTSVVSTEGALDGAIAVMTDFLRPLEDEQRHTKMEFARRSAAFTSDW